jgi:hypothetical protein
MQLRCSSFPADEFPEQVTSTRESHDNIKDLTVDKNNESLEDKKHLRYPLLSY